MDRQKASSIKGVEFLTKCVTDASSSKRGYRGGLSTASGRAAGKSPQRWSQPLKEANQCFLICRVVASSSAWQVASCSPTRTQVRPDITPLTPS